MLELLLVFIITLLLISIGPGYRHTIRIQFPNFISLALQLPVANMELSPPGPSRMHGGAPVPAGGPP